MSGMGILPMSGTGVPPVSRMAILAMRCTRTAWKEEEEGTAEEKKKKQMGETPI